MHWYKKAILGLAGKVADATVRPIILADLIIQFDPRPLPRMELSGASKPDGPMLMLYVYLKKYVNFNIKFTHLLLPSLPIHPSPSPSTHIMHVAYFRLSRGCIDDNSVPYSETKGGHGGFVDRRRGRMCTR